MVIQSWRRNPRGKVLAIATTGLAAGLLSALMTVSIGVGDKMAREMKTYGANILIEPAEQAVLPSLFGADEDNPLAEQSTLDETELPNIVSIFWRNNIVGFAPLLSGEVDISGQKTRIIGTFFDAPLPTPDDPEFHTGQKIVSPFWQVAGAWPGDGKAEVLVGEQLARRFGWKAGMTLAIGADTATVVGVLSTGGDEENAIVAPLKLVQTWLSMPGKVQSVRVSALTVPENELSRKAIKNPDALDAATYDLWYCTAYVSSIAHQLEEAVSGSTVRPIWQVAASEGVVIDKIQWLLAMATAAASFAAAMGIASLMTGTLMERSREVGLMKALGAEDWRIGILFYAEAVLSSLIGGGVGCVAGWGLASVIGQELFGEALSPPWIVFPTVVLISIVIALAGTWFAAQRIARLQPIEVLHGRH